MSGWYWGLIAWVVASPTTIWLWFRASRRLKPMPKPPGGNQ